MTLRPRKLAAVLIGVILCACMIIAWMSMHESKQDAMREGKALAECQRLASLIKAARQQPTRAQAREMKTPQFASLIESIAQQVGISRDQLLRISHQPARRLQGTVYEQVSTHIALDGVSLPRVLNFLRGLSGKNTSLSIASVSLDAPREQTTTERWQTEVTVTHLIYAPPTNASSGQRMQP